MKRIMFAIIGCVAAAPGATAVGSVTLTGTVATGSFGVGSPASATFQYDESLPLIVGTGTIFDLFFTPTSRVHQGPAVTTFTIGSTLFTYDTLQIDELDASYGRGISVFAYNAGDAADYFSADLSNPNHSIAEFPLLPSIANLSSYSSSAFHLNQSYLSISNIFPVATKVSLSSSVPEPKTWTIIVGGFGLVGSAMRRRRATVSYA